jgi:hypothetical protein
MSRERRLQLVRPPATNGDASGAADLPPEPPVSEAEKLEAERLRQALEADRDPLSNALRAAWSPSELAGVDHEALLARALGDEDAPPTLLERREASILRDELDGRPAPGVPSDAFALAGALRAAHHPGALDPVLNDEIVGRVLAAKAPRAIAGRRRQVLSVTMVAVSGLVALAAAVALVFRPAAESGGDAARGPSAAAPAMAAAFIPARSASDLFDAATPFPRSGGQTERIDRIAERRASDLRANRFAAWGVR